MEAGTFGTYDLLTPISDLKSTITTEGVWRIRRQERSPIIEIFKIEDAGHGDILSQEFLDWRLQLAESSKAGAVES